MSNNSNNCCCGGGTTPVNPQNNVCGANIDMAVCEKNIQMLPMLQTYNTIVLKPNLCCKKNILTQQMLSCEDTKYVIRWDFDLNGQTITVPERCILEFDGGSLKNGTIIGQDTVYINVGDVDIWGENLTRQGTWKEHSGGGGGSEEDRPYDPSDFVGMGKKYLQRNIVDGKNILTRGMINEANTIYVFQYDFDLNGQTINVPTNCVLEFDGGSLSNGTLVLNGTKINPQENIFRNVYMDGTCVNAEINTNWFDIDTTGNELCTSEIQSMLNVKVPNVLFSPGRYAFKSTDIKENVSITGLRNVVLVVQQRKPGVRGADHLFSVKSDSDVNEVKISNFEITGDTSGPGYDETNYNLPVLDFHNLNKVTVDNIRFKHCNFLKVWSENPNPDDLYQGNAVSLALFDDVTDTMFVNCEIDDCNGGEQVVVGCTNKGWDGVNVTFRNNYIHDINNPGNSPISVMNSNCLTFENNRMERFMVSGMTVCNLFGRYVYINSNTVVEDEEHPNNTFTQAFDTCEQGAFGNIFVVAKNNYMKAKNMTMLNCLSHNVIVADNVVQGWGLISNRGEGKKHDGTDGYMPEYDGENSFVVKGNVVDATYYDEEAVPSGNQVGLRSWIGPIRFGNDLYWSYNIDIDGNQIYYKSCANIATASLQNSARPINLILFCDNTHANAISVKINNNTIKGELPPTAYSVGWLEVNKYYSGIHIFPIMGEAEYMNNIKLVEVNNNSIYNEDSDGQPVGTWQTMVLDLYQNNNTKLSVIDVISCGKNRINNSVVSNISGMYAYAKHVECTDLFALMNPSYQFFAGTFSGISTYDMNVAKISAEHPYITRTTQYKATSVETCVGDINYSENMEVRVGDIIYFDANHVYQFIRGGITTIDSECYQTIINDDSPTYSIVRLNNAFWCVCPKHLGYVAKERIENFGAIRPSDLYIYDRFKPFYDSILGMVIYWTGDQDKEDWIDGNGWSAESHKGTVRPKSAHYVYQNPADGSISNTQDETYTIRRKVGLYRNRDIGFEFFDEELGKPIYASEISLTPNEECTWVDALGNTIPE